MDLGTLRMIGYAVGGLMPFIALLLVYLSLSKSKTSKPGKPEQQVTPSLKKVFQMKDHSKKKSCDCKKQKTALDCLKCDCPSIVSGISRKQGDALKGFQRCVDPKLVAIKRNCRRVAVYHGGRISGHIQTCVHRD